MTDEFEIVEETYDLATDELAQWLPPCEFCGRKVDAESRSIPHSASCVSHVARVEPKGHMRLFRPDQCDDEDWQTRLRTATRQLQGIADSRNLDWHMVKSQSGDYVVTYRLTHRKRRK